MVYKLLSTIFAINNFRFTGESYSSLEKLLLPFDATTWFLILMTIFISYVFIFALKFTNSRVRRIFYGNNIHNPAINVYVLIFGGCQDKIPTKNFARFIMMSFVLLCLVLRTCYQSQLYQFLQSDMRKPSIKTFDELVERNLTLYFNINYLDATRRMELFER